MFQPPDFGVVIEWRDHTGPRSRPQVPVELDAKAPMRRVRRVDKLDTLPLEPEQRQAARIYRQAVEHVSAGKGMGPLPWGRDVAGGTGPSIWLGPQERALSAADWQRRGMVAMGVVATVGVVQWAVIEERGLWDFDDLMGWTHGRSSVTLHAALDRLVVAYQN